MQPNENLKQILKQLYTPHYQDLRVLILLKTWRYISRLLTYLLTTCIRTLNDEHETSQPRRYTVNRYGSAGRTTDGWP